MQGQHNAPQDNTLETTIPYGPYIHPGSGKISGLYITGDFNSINRKEILQALKSYIRAKYHPQDQGYPATLVKRSWSWPIGKF